jgi:dienelactone hydrolase
MYSPDETHKKLLAQKLPLSFDGTRDFAAHQKQIKEKLTELLGETPERVPLDPIVEETVEQETFIERRISFAVEPDVRAVCILCIPKSGRKKYPLAVCLQGHGKGMHVSMGRRKYESEKPDTGDRDVAIQALKRGYAAICLDQRGFGERRTEIEMPTGKDGSPKCQVTAMNALMVGRTMIGERVWDVSRAIDLALTYPEIDGERILCTGNSGGGTTTYYAAAMDERIKVAMPSCAVCTFKSSICNIYHCVCNYIPRISKYMEMGDVAAAIAPRKLIVINGKLDNIFPQAGVEECFDTIKAIYTAAGVPDHCALATGEGGHRYYAAEAWGAFDAMSDWDI